MQQLGNTHGAVLPGGLRPLSARSVIASLLLGRRRPRASAADLVRWCGLFAIAPGTARVGLHRMVAAGEMARNADGYELVGALADRQREQAASLASRTRRWNGEWRLAVVGVTRARSAETRADLRVALHRARLAEWREGVWLRPHNLDDLVEDARCQWLGVRPDADPVALAADLFAPAQWARTAAGLHRDIVEVTERLREGDDGSLAHSFIAGASALHHIRADPLLPVELLPDEWPGAMLRRAYVTYQRTFAAAARVFFRSK